ncbi:MAG: serine/threonine-protein kinase [Myxococcota bacterium]
MLTVGQTTGSWKVEDLVGLGVPRTYRARHVEVGTSALLKITPLSNQSQAAQTREVGGLRVLDHQSIPEVLDFGTDHEQNVVWTAFRWYEGESLADRLQSGALPWAEACRIVRAVAAALAHAHARGIVHRDVRPANVFVPEEGTPRLIGFDLALTRDQLGAGARMPLGELAYLAPEVLHDPGHHGAKADVYAIGCVLYEALTGRPPFPAAVFGDRGDRTERMLEWKTRADELDVGPDVPEWLRNLVTKCTNPDPGKRLPDLDALLGWLDAARASWDPPVVALPVLTRTELRSVDTPQPITITPMMRRGPRVVERPRRPEPRPQGLPLAAQYAVAATLGCVSALGFSALVILFAEVRFGGI